MLERLNTYIRNELGLTGEEFILIAVSGGIDSVALAYLFHQSHLKFAIAHCNFNLRQEASEADAAFVSTLAQKFNVPFHLNSFDTLKIAENRRKSVQETARELRYAWFNELLQENTYDYVATAHHLNDSIETILYNLTKGTGIRGLHGILPKSGNVIRPLMFATRGEIEDYVKTNQIQFNEDFSNYETKYSRNKIRLDVIPALKEINPSLEVTFRENIKRVKEIEAVYKWAISKIREEIFHADGSTSYIDLDKVKTFPALSTLLFELLTPFGFNNDQVSRILEEKATSSGRQFFSDTHRLVTNRGQLLISVLHPGKAKNNLFVDDDTTVLKAGNSEFHFSRVKRSDIDFGLGSHFAFLDARKIEFPLTIRRWRQGDYFKPLGMKGKSQKVSDYFTNAKLSIPEKEKAWIVETAGKICWIAGYRIDERFKMTDRTREVLKIHFRP